MTALGHGLKDLPYGLRVRNSSKCGRNEEASRLTLGTVKDQTSISHGEPINSWGPANPEC